jgi:threonine/homoserine/homoserine lactone efflux protein
MGLITPFLFGFLVAFIGSITPSMLNMSALKISIQKDVKSAKRYVFGVSLVVLLQAYIAVFLSQYVIENPSILELIEQFGIGIFLLLSFYFYKESKKEKAIIQIPKTKQTNDVLFGMTLSALNMFAIPFFCGVVAFLEFVHLFSFALYPVLLFCFGAGLGTFGILFLYVKYAQKIQQKTGKFTQDINLFLSILTALVAIISLIKQGYQSI